MGHDYVSGRASKKKVDAMRYAMVKAKERSEQAKCKLHGSQSQHSCSDSPAVCRFNVTLIPTPFSGMRIEASSVCAAAVQSGMQLARSSIASS